MPATMIDADEEAVRGHVDHWEGVEIANYNPPTLQLRVTPDESPNVGLTTTRLQTLADEGWEVDDIYPTTEGCLVLFR